MDLLDAVGSLPAFTALSAQAVLEGSRSGTSLQIDRTYFDGQVRALQSFEENTKSQSDVSYNNRVGILQDSWQKYTAIDVDIDSITEQDLWEATTQFWRQLQQLPEIDFLDQNYPGQCFVLPEWLKTEEHLHYGARVYFFRSEGSPSPEDILQKNIDAILDDSFEAFERYQGRLHGYPDCCIDCYHERSPESPSPEWRSINPYADRVNTQALGAGESGSIDAALPQFTEWDGRYAFFAREFFPEPGCGTARSRGRTIYDALVAGGSSRVVEDYFRLIFGYNYLVATAVHTGGSHRPMPGDLGREHLMFYLPLHELVTMPRYTQ